MLEKPEIIYETVKINDNNINTIVTGSYIIGSLGQFDSLRNVINIFNYVPDYKNLNYRLRLTACAACDALNSQPKDPVIIHELHHWKNFNELTNCPYDFNYYEYMWLFLNDELSARLAPIVNGKEKNSYNTAYALERATAEFIKHPEPYTKYYKSRLEMSVNIDFNQHKLTIGDVTKKYSKDCEQLINRFYTIEDLCLFDVIDTDTKESKLWKDYQSNLIKIKNLAEEETKSAITAGLAKIR